MESIDDKILSKLQKCGRGVVFSAARFAHFKGTNIRYILIIILLLSTFSNTKGQNNNDKETFLDHHEICFNWDFKGDIIARQIGYNYLFNNYIGIGCGVGFWCEIESGSLLSSDFWEDNDGLFRLFIMPKIKISTPYIIKTNRVKINCFTEDGWMLNRKFKRTITAWNDDFSDKKEYTFTSKNGSYNLSLGLFFKLSDSGGFGVGYSFSTLEYSKKVDYFNEDKPLSKENLNGIFLTINIVL